MRIQPAIPLALLALTLLAACRSPNQSVNPETNPPAPSSPAPIAASPTSPHGGQGGQVIETGVYHLEFIALLEPNGTHLDFFLQKGDNHIPIANAKVIAQVQLPDGSQKALEMLYAPTEKHYTVFLPATLAGEYRVTILNDIGGEKVNGRFTFKR